MKEKIKNILALILLVLLLPYVITVLMSGKLRQTYLDRGDDHSFISVEVDGKVHEVNFEDYVMGVTALQIPSAYQTETIKAQMIVARTNLSKMLEEHPTDLLKDRYLTVDQMEELGIRDKFSRASRETNGQVLTYDGNLILASYHSISAGRTRDGNDVLGSRSYPYLTSVQSAQDVEAERYLHAEVYDPEAILRICREQYPDMKAYYPETALNVKADGRDSVRTSYNAEPGAGVLPTDIAGAETEILTEAAETESTKAAQPKDETDAQTQDGTDAQIQDETGVQTQPDSDNESKDQELNGKNLWDNMEIVSNDKAGYITKIRIGNTEIPGEEFRKFLNLNSSCFTMEQVEKGIRITTKGLGHGVGMSQYGAERMAESGKPYDAILQYYFKNVTIEINEKQKRSETDTNAVNS